MASNFSDFTIETTNKAYECLDKVKNCEKNPTHEQFHSLADLNMDILPSECGRTRSRTKQWLEFIRFYSKRVVKLTVYNSDGRRHGTGCVGYSTYLDKLFIQTNKHVVSSQEDVSTCQIEFFYDTVDRTGIVPSKGMELLGCLENPDICLFTFGPVPQTIKHLLISDESIVIPPVTDLCNMIAISHPHGGPKTVTIGKQLSDERDDGVLYHVHTARTCQGSSGCPVIDTSCMYTLSVWRYGLHDTHFAGYYSEDYEGKHSDTLNVNYSVS